MERRDFIKGFIALGACPACARAAHASGLHWGYSGMEGPEHWADLDSENAACSAGSQQSPVNLSGTIDADLPKLTVSWTSDIGWMVNNGHTIQIDLPAGGILTRGDRRYTLLQFHFHAPSEHRVDGKAFPLEAHFVHEDKETGVLGVLAVFLTPGTANPAFAELAAMFPAAEGGKVAIPLVAPDAFLPASLRYWLYEGSLTTPPCSENVDWMVLMDPVEVAAEDIARFTAIYPANARPFVAPNRRFILSSR